MMRFVRERGDERKPPGGIAAQFLRVMALFVWSLARVSGNLLLSYEGETGNSDMRLATMAEFRTHLVVHDN